MTIPKILLVVCLSAVSYSITAQVTTEEHDVKVNSKIDQMPVFPYDIGEYLSEHLIYPFYARKNNIEGRVIVSFIVNKNGSLDSIKIVNGIGGGCDEEVIRIIEGMPAWKPGKHNGKIVRVKFFLPVVFKLED